MSKYLNFLFTVAVFFLAGIAIAHASEVPQPDFLMQVFETIKNFGGLAWAGKLAAILMLVVGSMKVSFLRPLWDKFGPLKAIVAPLLSLIAGAVMLPVIDLQGMLAYLFAGAGSILFHELLDAAKGIPGLGNMYMAIIEFITKILGGSSQPAVK